MTPPDRRRERALWLAIPVVLVAVLAILLVVGSLGGPRPEYLRIDVADALAEPDPAARWGSEEIELVGWYANLEGDYFDGIPADCPAPDDASHQLGDPEEGSLAEALTFIRTGACTPRTAEQSRALRLRPSMPRLAGWASLVNAQ